jgi:hypothetical protein
MEPPLKLPLQTPPVQRNSFMTEEHAQDGGVEASQTPCDNLTGMARQLCFASEYGVDI